MIKKINSILKHYSIKRILLVYILFLIGSFIIAQDSLVIENKSWINKLTEEDRQQIALANQNLELANSILAEADSMENEIKLIKSSGDTTELKKIDVLSKNISQRRYNAYQIVGKANNSKILIYSASINKEISKIDATTEYYETISKLLKTAKNNLDQATILRKELIAEKDTNQIFEKSISSNTLENETIQDFEEIFNIMMIIEEDPVNSHDSAYISQIEPEFDEPESDVLNYEAGIITYGNNQDSTLIEKPKPDSVSQIKNDSLDVTIDTSFSFIDKRHVTVQDSEGNSAYEKSVAVQRSLLDFKKDTHKIAIGTGDPAKYVNVIVNEKVVETIKLAIENYEEDTVFDIFSITAFDIDLIRNAWDNYVEEITPVIESDFDIKFDIGDEDDLTLATIVENKDNGEISYAKEIEETIEKTTVKEPKETVKKTTIKEPKEKIEYKTHHIDRIIFRVQIAADGVPLNDKKLKTIYNGKRKIKMFQEEGWYKYYIADCNTLKEAILIKKESKVSDAFIMAYKDGVKIQFYLKFVKPDEIKKSNERKDEYRNLVNLSKDKTTIVVQIVASRIPMKDSEIKKIYSGNELINYIEEEGWHKYSIGNFAKFRDANSLRKTLEVPGAFVVAYKNGEKIDLWAKYRTN